MKRYLPRLFVLVFFTATIFGCRKEFLLNHATGTYVVSGQSCYITFSNNIPKDTCSDSGPVTIIVAKSPSSNQELAVFDVATQSLIADHLIYNDPPCNKNSSCFGSILNGGGCYSFQSFKATFPKNGDIIWEGSYRGCGLGGGDHGSYILQGHKVQ